MPRGIPKNPAARKQTEKQQRFAAIYADPGIKGNNAVTAYVEAGYASLNKAGNPDKTLRQRAYGVLHTPSMQRKVAQIRSEREAKAEARDSLSVDQIRHEHWVLYDRAVVAGNLSEQRQNVEALGRTIAAYVDRSEIDVGRQRELSEAERAEALVLAGLLLERRGGLAIDEHPVTAGATLLTQGEQPGAALGPLCVPARARPEQLMDGQPARAIATEPAPGQAPEQRPSAPNGQETIPE